MKSLLLSVMLLLSLNTPSKGQVGIGTNSPDSSAILELSSNQKGFLVPRMTENQKLQIKNPAVGLLIFQFETKDFWVYDGAKWNKLISTSNIITTTPTSPLNLVSEKTFNSKSIKLRWQDASTNEEGFIVERKTNGNEFTQIGITPKDLNFFLDTNVTNLSVATYRVYSFNHTGPSTGYSNEISVIFKKPSIKAVGYEVIANSLENAKAIIWNDSTEIQFDEGATSGVFFSGVDTYISGTYFGSPTKIVLWKNGIKDLEINNGTNSTVISQSLFLNGPDKYISGFELNSLGRTLKYWKNGIAISITSAESGIFNNNANSIFINGSDVYIGGTDSGKAKIWKNGIATTLSSGIPTETYQNYGEVYSIIVSNTDIYACGIHNSGNYNHAKYWKNGVETDLSLNLYNATAKCIAVSGNDIYVAGGIEGLPVVWKNGVPGFLNTAGGMYDIISLKVIGNDIYVGGTETKNGKSRAILWVNGSLIPLSDPNKNIYLTGLFVF